MRKIRSKCLKGQKEESGFILIVSTMIIIFMFTVATPFLFKLSAQYKTTEKSYKSIAALNLAEAGVERAIWELNYGDISSWTGDSSLRTMIIPSFQASNGAVVGNIEISVVDPEGYHPVVEAVGQVPFSGNYTVTKTIRVVLDSAEPVYAFDYGIFANDGITLNNNNLVDSYDSTQGLYGGLNKGSVGSIGTNSTSNPCVSMLVNSKIYGDVATGPGSNPDQVITMGNGSQIYGIKHALSEIKELPSVEPPQDLPSMGAYTASGIQTISQSGEYSSFHLTGGSSLTISGDVKIYVTGDFVMDSNSELNIAAGSNMKIYLAGSFQQASNTEFNNLSKNPTAFMILGTDNFTGQITWSSNTELYGGVYAPKADFHLSGNVTMYGSVVTNSIYLDSNAKLHYDVALGQVDLTEDGDYRYFVKSWQEKRSSS